MLMPKEIYHIILGLNAEVGNDFKKKKNYQKELILQMRKEGSKIS